MSLSSEQWFVQTSFGTLLGPMPEDALAEMARTGALLRTDKLREGQDGVWHSAAELPGLFDGIASPSTQPGSRVGDLLPRSMPDGSFVMTKASELPRILEETTSQKPEQESLPEPPPLNSVDEVYDVFWRMSEPAESKSPPQRSAHSPESDATIDSAQDETEFEVDVPIRVPTTTASTVEVDESDLDIDRLLQSPTSTARRTPAVPLPVIENLDFGTPPETASTPVASPVETNPPSPVEFRREPSRVLPQQRLASRKWTALLAVGKRHWPACAATCLVLVLIAVWWFWPRHQTGLFARYEAIHEELQKFRKHPQDSAGLKEFVTRSNAELNQIVSSLEEANQDHETQLLLFVGRDCLLEMLKKPLQEDVRRERQFAAFTNQLKEIYDPTLKTDENATDDSAGSKQVAGTGPIGSKVPLPNSKRSLAGDWPNSSNPAGRTNAPANTTASPMARSPGSVMPASKWPAQTPGNKTKQ